MQVDWFTTDRWLIKINEFKLLNATIVTFIFCCLSLLVYYSWNCI